MSSLLRSSLMFLLGCCLAPTLAAAATQPRAAVTFTDARDQPRKALKSLRAVLERQLEQHDITVLRKAPLIATSPRQIKKYAQKKRLDRVYDIRLQVQGKTLLVVLTERKTPGMKSTFSARLPASSLDKVAALIPKLVSAVVARAEPEEEKVAVAPPPQAQVELQAVEAVSPPPPPAPDAQAPRRGEFLIGASLDLGTYLHSAAGLYGATGKLFYQWTALRLGAEVGGRGGGGTAFSLAARADYLFSRSGINPLVGAGLGYVLLKDGAGAQGGGGFFSASLGLEYARMRSWRLVGEAEFILPFFAAKREEIQNVNGIVGLAGVRGYSPAALFKFGFLY